MSSKNFPLMPRLPNTRKASSEFYAKTLSARRFIATVPVSEERQALHLRRKAKKIEEVEPCLKSKLDFFHSYHNLSKALEMRKVRPASDAHLAYLQCIEKEHMSPTPVGIIHSSRVPETTVNVPFAFIGDRLASALSEGMKHTKHLECVNLRGNRLSRDSSRKIIKRLPLNSLTSLDMTGNRFGMQAVNSLLQVLESGALRTLHLENCQLTTADLEKLFQSATLSKTLTELNLAKNNLGEEAGKLLGHFLMYTSTLKSLDIHWNCIRASGATQLFQGLKENSRLEVLDVSWNVMDSHDVYGLSASLANALELDDHLKHLDLSFNYLSKEQCTVIAKGLSENHTLLGMHVIGNYAMYDARGYLQPADVCLTEEANYFHRILAGRKPKGQNCWLCDGWVEVEFRYQGLAAPPLFLHLEIDNYQPELMEQHGGIHILKRVLPIGTQHFFFTSKDELEISGAYAVIKLNPASQFTVTYWPGHIQTLSLSKMQVSDLQGTLCTLERRLDTEPRTPHAYSPPLVPKEKVPWSLPISLFQPYKFDTEQLIEDCFEFDWNLSRCGKLVKDAKEAVAFKETLRKAYKHM